MIGYWKEFYYDPANPETATYLIDYVKWMAYAYPMFLLQLPLVTLILFTTFKPEYKDLSRAVTKLRMQVLLEGPLKPSGLGCHPHFHIGAVRVDHVFAAAWHGHCRHPRGGGFPYCRPGAVGRCQFLASTGAYVLLYAAAISLGVQMKETGAAVWVATNFLKLLAPFGADQGLGLWGAVSALTTIVTNTMSNGAAVAVLGPIVLKMATVAGESPIIIGFITAVSSAFAYLTVVGTPACTIVYASGYLKASDFLNVGSRMVVVSIIIMLAAAWIYWPLIGA